MDYHFVQVKDNEILLLYQNFYDDKGNETLKAERPRPSRQYKDQDLMDLSLRDNSLDLLKVLQWIELVFC